MIFKGCTYNFFASAFIPKIGADSIFEPNFFQFKNEFCLNFQYLYQRFHQFDNVCSSRFGGNVMQKTLILLCPRLKSPQQSWTVKNDRSKTDSRLVHCHQAATKKEALASFLSNKKSLFKWVLHNAPFAEKRAPS